MGEYLLSPSTTEPAMLDPNPMRAGSLHRAFAAPSSSNTTIRNALNLQIIDTASSLSRGVTSPAANETPSTKLVELVNSQGSTPLRKPKLALFKIDSVSRWTPRLLCNGYRCDQWYFPSRVSRSIAPIGSATQEGRMGQLRI
jgi:hypothetical protein